MIFEAFTAFPKNLLSFNLLFCRIQDAKERTETPPEPRDLKSL